jgi:hypothetical protein
VRIVVPVDSRAWPSWAAPAIVIALILAVAIVFSVVYLSSPRIACQRSGGTYVLNSFGQHYPHCVHG